MNEVAKYYTPLTPFLEKWDETANQDDFTYFAVMGTLGSGPIKRIPKRTLI